MEEKKNIPNILTKRLVRIIIKEAFGDREGKRR